MNIGAKKRLVRLAILGASMLTPSLALAEITLDGTAPTGRSGLVVIQQNRETGTTGALKFKFSAPGKGAYSLNFCIGPAANPCGVAGAYVVVVPAGQSRLAVVNANIFETNVLLVGQGTNSPVPYSVSIE